MPFEKKEKIKIICKHCGKEIYVKPWRAKKQKYCSMACYNVVKSKRLKSKRLKFLHSLENQKIVIQCQNKLCNKKFIINKCFKNKRKYCCQECYFQTKRKDYLIKINKRKINERKIDIAKNIWKLNQI